MNKYGSVSNQSDITEENLYEEILEKNLLALTESWDSTKLEENNMSPMYNIIKNSNAEYMNVIGYAYYDVNDEDYSWETTSEEQIDKLEI